MDIISYIKNTDDVKLITKTTESECVNNCNVCSSKKLIQLMSEFINKKDTDTNIVKYIEDKLNCTSESCVLNNKRFNNFIQNKLGNSNITKYELATRFKTHGPRNNNNLLSNVNIDDTLILWSREFTDFYPCPFSMIDFKLTENKFCQFKILDMIKGNESFYDPVNGLQKRIFNTYGCVLNTDVSTGKGKHWVCIFVDCRPKLNIWTIEYFNSSGNSPHKHVMEWMENQRIDLIKIHPVDTVTVTNIVHQKSNTECGMYVLYYIRSRLDGISYTHFLTNRISDSDVFNFRKHVFRKD
jgi:hypothetical protein